MRGLRGWSRARWLGVSRSLLPAVAVCLLPAAVAGLESGWSDRMFRRGDANNDSLLDIADVSTLLSYLFEGGSEPPCMNQADVNDDGTISITDPIFLALYLYVEGPPPPPPGPVNPHCDPDPTEPHLDCMEYYCP